MLKSVRIDAGLGNPPSEYINNDPEAANFMIKHGLQFDAKKPHEFIEEIRNIIETQQRNENRAVFGKGPYKVRKGFAHLVVDDIMWGQLNQDQRRRKLSSFLNAGIGDKKDPIEDLVKETVSCNAPSSAINAENSGITTIPIAILEAMFEKAANLLATPGSVIQKPGATDGSFIVAGVCNKIHVVTPGKGGSLVCDRSCVNFSTKICEHTLAVAQFTDKCNELIAWYKRSKRGPKMVDMALRGGPKSAGKKPSNRKRSNVKSQPVYETVDLLQDPSAPPSKQVKGDSNAHFEQRPSMAFSNPLSHANNSSGGPGQNQCLHQQGLHQMFLPSSGSPSSALPSEHVIGFNNVLSPAAGLQDNGFLPGPSQYLSPFSHQSSGLPSHVGTVSYNVGYAYQQPHTSQSEGLPSNGANHFQLKWLAGTRVSRCYGCGGDIQNPPLEAPDDLIIVYKDIRRYRDRNTGQLHCTNSPQNVHFHLRIACVRAQYAHFTANSLFVSIEFASRRRLEHFNRLVSEFGWTP